MYHNFLYQQAQKDKTFLFKNAIIPVVALLLLTATALHTMPAAFASDNAPAGASDYLFLPLVAGPSVSALNSTGNTPFAKVHSAQLVPNNVPPVLTNPGAQTTKVNTTVNLQMVATDADGDPITYSAAGLPVGVSISSSSGLITGTPTLAGSFNTEIFAGDLQGGTAVANFAWTVSPQSGANITNPGSQTAKVDDTVNLAIIAVDPDGDPITYSATGLPSGLSINTTTGVISGIPTTVATSNVTVNVDDGYDTSSISFSWGIDPAGTAYIGDMVFLDRNGNGQRDLGLGEPGVDGVTVRLLDGSGTELKSTVTSGGGRYVFDQLPAGTYIIAFVSNGTPFTAQHAGDGGLDSDANPSTGRTAPIALGDGVWMDWIDAGLNPNEQLAQVGGNVYDDLNRNGRHNSGEPAVSSVTVRLMSSSGSEAAVAYSDNGKYRFTNIPTGSYSIVVESQDPAYEVASSPGAFTVCCGQANLNNHVAMRSTGVSSGTGGSTGGETTPSTGGGTTPSAAATISGMTYLDANRNGRLNTGEQGVANSRVQLLNSSGASIASTYTDGSGNYTFSNVDAGSYTVRFTKPSRSYRFTTSSRVSVTVSSGESKAGVIAGLRLR